MQGPLAQAVIAAWEHGLTQHPLDRALALVALAHPDATWDELASLPIGQRDARLLALHQSIFGGRLHASADCPACAEPLEFQVTAQQLLGELGHDQQLDSPRSVDLAGRQVRVRLLDSRDLADAARAESEADARSRLVARCLVDGPLQLTEQEYQQLSARLLELDPGAEILMKLDCPACRHSWQAPFDTAAFVWSEVAAEARRLLQQVHDLARAYHWSEAAILELSPRRRGYYLALVGA